MLRELCLLVLASTLAACDDGCRNEVLETVPSLSRDLKAVVFQRDCGAATGFSTQISILRADEKLRGGGNTFVADTDHGAAPSGAGGGPPVGVTWDQAGKLKIEVHPAARVFKQETQIGDTQVVYSHETP